MDTVWGFKNSCCIVNGVARLGVLAREPSVTQGVYSWPASK